MYAKPDSFKDNGGGVGLINMQNHFDCFCFPVIPLNLTNCLNVMNLLISNTPRDLNLKFSHF